MKLVHLILTTALFACFHATVAFARPTLLSATPTANATAERTDWVKLDFSERLEIRLSRATLVMTGMPGMANHNEMRMPGVTTRISRDGKSIILVSTRPLPSGSYRVDWVVAGSDSQRVTGRHVFSIR